MLCPVHVRKKSGIVTVGDAPEFCDIRGFFCLKPSTAHPMPMRVYGHALSDGFVMKKGEIKKNHIKFIV